MLKRFFFTPVCLVVLVMLLSACDVSVHAKNAHPVLPTAKTTVVVASPVAQSTITSPIAQSTAASPVVSASAVVVATDPPPVVQAPVISSAPPRRVPASPTLPTFAPDPGASIIYNGSGAQGGRNETRTFTSSFPATPGFIVHIICRGYGLIRVEVSSGIINELSCPQSDNTNQYYTDPAPSPRYAIRVTTMGAITWRVVVEAAG